MPPKSIKRKRMALTVAQKLELIRKLEKGASVTSVCEEYGVAKQTVSDIRKSKDKLVEYSAKYCVDASASKSGKGAPRKNVRTGKDAALDAAVMKWYVQQRSVGMNVRGIEILAAARKLAQKMEIENFRGSDGWLWRFRNRHGLFNATVRGEAGDADTASIEPFRIKLDKLIQDEHLSYSQVYNGDETGFFWRSMPKNSQMRKGEETVKGKKSSKERLSVLVCANASGTHRLKLAVVGKSKAPRALRAIISDLPVHYFASAKAWFTSAIFLEWFKKYFVPAVREYQIHSLKIAPEDVKALLILDNAPAHPSESVLVSDDGRIRVMFMPPNTTSVIQPMDQGIISALKRRYITRYLDEVLVVLQEDDEAEDTRGARTLANIKAYSIRSALYNFAYSWDAMKVSTLANCWKKLLQDKDIEANFEGFEAEDIHRLLQRGGETGPSVDDVRDWLEEQEDDPGYQVMTEDDIVASVTNPEEENSSEDEDEVPVKKVKLSTLRTYIDALLDYTTYSTIPETSSHYGSLRMLRELIIKEQHQGGRQTKVTNFFSPVRRPTSPAPAPDSPEPGPSGLTAPDIPEPGACGDFEGFTSDSEAMDQE